MSRFRATAREIVESALSECLRAKGWTLPQDWETLSLGTLLASERARSEFMVLVQSKLEEENGNLELLDALSDDYSLGSFIPDFGFPMRFFVFLLEQNLLYAQRLRPADSTDSYFVDEDEEEEDEEEDDEEDDDDGGGSYRSSNVTGGSAAPPAPHPTSPPNTGSALHPDLEDAASDESSASAPPPLGAGTRTHGPDPTGAPKPGSGDSRRDASGRVLDIRGSESTTFAAGAVDSTEEPSELNATLVQVFYATDRMQGPSYSDGPTYSSSRSHEPTINYGRCRVSIPKVHKVGHLETPSILRLEFRPDPRKHILLADTLSLAEQEFFNEIGKAVSKSAAREAFVFVHGYNVSFEDAARRTGQFAFDLDFVGAPIFFSWPSNGRVADYMKDEANITWSTPHLKHFLAILADRSGAQRIHVIAHSMGNRAVCDALKSMNDDLMGEPKISHVMLAAPDIDADTFRELAAALHKVSAHITLYQSSRDKALLASKKLHGNPRAGEPVLVMSGMDTVDASAIDTDFLGHSYFSDNWPLLSDIHSVISRDARPAARFGLVQMKHADGVYYAFRA